MRKPAIFKRRTLWQRAVGFINEILVRMYAHHGTTAAAAVSFYVFLSLGPLLLLAGAALGFVLKSHDRAYEALSAFLTHKPFAISSGDAGRLLEEIMRGSTAATGIGAVMLFWSGAQAFVGMEKAFDMMWNCKPRRFLPRTITAIGMMLTAGVMLIVSIGITTGVQALKHIHLRLAVQNAPLLIGWTEKLAALLVSFVIAAITFTIIYKIIPNRRTPIKPAIVGGITAAAMWEAAKQAFGLYLEHFAKISTVYGSLGAVIVLMLWIYCSAIVIMLGAETAALYEARTSSIRRRH